ncbi:hypothetical protein D9M68_664580 [compost metagenome]
MHAQLAAGRQAGARHFRFRGLYLQQDETATLQQQLSVVGQRQAARGAVQQLHAQLALQQGNAFADGGRRHAEPVRGGGEAAAVRDTHEIEDVLEMLDQDVHGGRAWESTPS